MSLITVNGSNPFVGQSDPYITLNSSVSYDNGPQGAIVNSYSLQGVLTGCSASELSTRRDALANSFDWKKDTGIIENITIIGVVSASPSAQIIPTNLSFDASNYIGALPYSLSLDIFTGFEKSAENEYDLFDRVHTVVTDIDYNNDCTTISTTLGATPNSNVSQCGALEKANQWIASKLGSTELGSITMQSKYDVQNESLDIDPINGGLSFNRTESNCKDNQSNTADAGMATGLLFSYCIDTDDDQPCSNGPVTQTYKGEVYDSGKSSSELVREIKDRLFPTMVGITSFNATYNQNSSNIQFDATRVVDGKGSPMAVSQDVEVDIFSKTTSRNFIDGSSNGSINGSIQIINPVTLSPLSVNSGSNPPAAVRKLAKGHAGVSSKMEGEQVSYDNVNGGVSYSASWQDKGPNAGPDSDVPNLDGVTGLSSWSINFTPPLNAYRYIENLNCDDLILDLGYANRGSISINTVAISGSGYNFEAVAAQKGQQLVNLIAGNRSELQVTKKGTMSEGIAATFKYAATFKGPSAVNRNNINISL